jgi:Fungal protein kinase
MHDFFIAHRWVLNVKGILHRDISINNILLPLEPTTTADIKSRPKFIDEILDSESGFSLLVHYFS